MRSSDPVEDLPREAQFLEASWVSLGEVSPEFVVRHPFIARHPASLRLDDRESPLLRGRGASPAQMKVKAAQHQGLGATDRQRTREAREGAAEQRGHRFQLRIPPTSFLFPLQQAKDRIREMRVTRRSVVQQHDAAEAIPGLDEAPPRLVETAELHEGYRLHAQHTEGTGTVRETFEALSRPGPHLGVHGEGRLETAPAELAVRHADVRPGLHLHVAANEGTLVGAAVGNVAAREVVVEREHVAQVEEDGLVPSRIAHFLVGTSCLLECRDGLVPAGRAEQDEGAHQVHFPVGSTVSARDGGLGCPCEVPLGSTRADDPAHSHPEQGGGRRELRTGSIRARIVDRAQVGHEGRQVRTAQHRHEGQQFGSGGALAKRRPARDDAGYVRGTFRERTNTTAQFHPGRAQQREEETRRRFGHRPSRQAERFQKVIHGRLGATEPVTGLAHSTVPMRERSLGGDAGCEALQFEGFAKEGDDLVVRERGGRDLARRLLGGDRAKNEVGLGKLPIDRARQMEGLECRGDIARGREAVGGLAVETAAKRERNRLVSHHAQGGVAKNVGIVS